MDLSHRHRLIHRACLFLLEDTLGYGFVRYALAEDAQQAIDTLSKKKFRGKRTLLLEIAKHRQRHADSKVTSASGVVDAEETSDQEATEMTTEDRPVVAPIAATGANAQAIATGPAKPMVFTKGHKDHLRTVLVRGLPTEVTKKQLYKKARKFGDVKEVVMPVSVGEDAAPIELAGHARVVYQHPMDADKAVKQLDKHVFKGKTVFACKAPNVQAAKKEARVLVRNVPFLVGSVRSVAISWHAYALYLLYPVH